MSGLFPPEFLTKIVYPFLILPVHATCSTHLILLDLIILVTYDEMYNLRSSPLLYIHFLKLLLSSAGI